MFEQVECFSHQKSGKKGFFPTNRICTHHSKVVPKLFRVLTQKRADVSTTTQQQLQNYLRRGKHIGKTLFFHQTTQCYTVLLLGKSSHTLHHHHHYLHYYWASSATIFAPFSLRKKLMVGERRKYCKNYESYTFQKCQITLLILTSYLISQFR